MGDLAGMPIVVKVGGSLYDLADLGKRLQAWLATLATQQVLLIPGGGLMADAVRRLDQLHGLGEEKSHWLALRALTLNAYFLADLLPRASVIGSCRECAVVWAQGGVPVLDAVRFALDDELEKDRLPHRWDITSDALAWRVAVVLPASQLVLLKSVTIPAEMGWEEAGKHGLVDGYLARCVSRSNKRFAALAVSAP